LKLADSNVWLAMAVEDHQHHKSVAAWMAELTAHAEVAMCRATQIALLRLLTTKALMNGYGSRPLTNSEAWDVCNRVLTDSRVTYLHEPPNVNHQWERFAVRETVSPKLWLDAYLAAFAIRSDCTLVTFDRAFQQFDGLKLEILAVISS
jgi:toxin-antitoxin system PIN domain toxin